MVVLKYHLIVIIKCVLLLTLKSTKGLKRSETLDSEGRFQVSWEVEEIQRIVTFEVIAKTTGYVGFGISENPGMSGADIIIGGVLPDGTPYFQDYYAETNGMPNFDDHRDWTLLEYSETNGFTYLKFSRPISTCDNQDVPIKGDAQRFIFAMGQDDDIKYHELDRGAFYVNILDPPPPEIDLSQYQQLDVILDMTMPQNPTSYWCSVHRSPFFEAKQHIVAFGPKIIGPDAQKHTHHFMFNLCKVPDGEDPEAFFERFVIPGGQDCFAGTSERSLEIYKYCSYTIYSWAMGGRMIHMPENVGFPLSEGGREYFMLETHLNNPGSRANISLQSGVQIYYTENLRSQEAESFSMGTQSEWAILVPPSSTNFKLAVHCTSACTNFLEPEGYTIFNVQLHAHTSARNMRLRHFRDGTELPWIADDQSYDNKFQNNRNIHPVRFLPGDHITLECGYDNTWIKPPGTVIAGMSTTDEMCTSVLYYYPRGNFSICGSNNLPYRLMNLIGIDGSSTQISPQDPRIRNYLDTKVEWTIPLREAVQRELTFGPHHTICMVNGIDQQELDETILQSPSIATYPVINKEFQPLDECKVKSQPVNEFNSKHRIPNMFIM